MALVTHSRPFVEHSYTQVKDGIVMRDSHYLTKRSSKRQK
jgi:hypothetical protein